MRIRPARGTDAGALARIFHDAVQIGSASVYSQAQRDDWSLDCPSDADWGERIEGLLTLVAEDGGRPVGFLSMDGEGLIDLLFVTPGRIGQGVGYALYLQSLKEARAIGLARMTVECSAMSRDFFARQGWRETGTKDRGEGAARITTTLMAFDLPR